MTLGKSTGFLARLSKSLVRSAGVKAFATALLLSPVPLIATTTEAPSQVGFSVSFGGFYDELAPYGTWHRHARWGDVWRPRRIEADFRPYYRGHWEYTGQYGWLWVSDHIWGDIPFHYGRWVYDPFDGWLWIPGYVWSPAWVVWRSGGGYTGWFPMPPDDGFLYGGGDPYFNRWDNWDRGFGYTDWYGPSVGAAALLNFWIFIEDRRFADRDYIRYMPPRNNFVTIVNNTTNITNYVTVNNYIVNRSINVERIERASGRQIARVEARNVLRRNASITTVDVGSRVQTTERRNHGGNRNASARERIVALPEERARAIGPGVGGGQNKGPAERVIGPQGGRGNGKGNDNDQGPRNAGPDNDRDRGPDRQNVGKGGGGGGGGPDNDRAGGPNRPNFGNGPGGGGGNGPGGGIERRAGGNGPGGNGPGPNQAINRQPDRGPQGGVQARQAGPQNEGPQGGGGGANNPRVDRNAGPDRAEKGGGGGGGGGGANKGGGQRGGNNKDR